MNTTQHIPRPRPGFTGEWSFERFIEVLKARGVDHTSGAAVAKAITDYRRTIDPDAPALDRRTANRWIKGNDPARAPGGCKPFVFEIALAFDVSVEWLLGGAPWTL